MIHSFIPPCLTICLGVCPSPYATAHIYTLAVYQFPGRGSGAVGYSICTTSGRLGVRIPTTTYLKFIKAGCDNSTA